jgi:hypothetical protein
LSKTVSLPATITKEDRDTIQAADLFQDTPLETLAEWINNGHSEIKMRVRRTAIDVAQIGSWLCAAKDKCGHGSWLPWLSENCSEISERTSQIYMKVYKRIGSLSNTKLISDMNPTEAYRALGVIKEAEDNVHFSSESNEWYTPPDLVETISDALGGISLDPCSNSEGEPNIPAEEHFTEADDGLTREWHGTVYMNPPYGDDIGNWTSKLMMEYEAGRVDEAIALVPSRTDTMWFRVLKNYPRCFLYGRLKFSGHENSAPFPSMLVYFGKDLPKFIRAFKHIGDVYVRAEE